MTNIEKFGKVTHDNLPQAIEHLINLMSIQVEHQIETETPQSNDEDEIDIKQASILLKKSPSTIYRYTCYRNIPYYKVGNSLRFRKSELMEWIKAQNAKAVKEETTSDTATNTGVSISKKDNR